MSEKYIGKDANQQLLFGLNGTCTEEQIQMLKILLIRNITSDCSIQTQTVTTLSIVSKSVINLFDSFANCANSYIYIKRETKKYNYLEIIY